MNIIINGFHHPKQIEIIDWIVKHYNPKHLIYICDPSCPYIQSNEDLIVENFYYSFAGHGKYDLRSCDVLDEDIIEKMASYEAVILRMIDRLEYYEKRTYSYNERKLLYLKHLRYWNSQIKNKKIGVYIGTNIPHEIYDYVIYGLAKIYNLQTYFFLQSQINDLIHPMSDWEENCKAIKSEYLNLKNSVDLLKFDSVVSNEWQSQMSNNSPFYMKPAKKIIRFKQLISSMNKYLHPRYYYRQFGRDINRVLKNRRLKHEYSKVTTNQDLTSKYFYVALHYQPELTTCPIGGAYVDQFLIIEMLDKYLPPGINIYIKEHPKQEITSRTFDYYRHILENKKRVFFVPLKTDTYRLIENSIAVVTVSGTVGWEALFRKKPVLLFGHNFYQYAPSVFSIKSNQDCINAINSIVANEVIFSEFDLNCFIQATYNCSIKGIIDSGYDLVSKIGIEESNKNIFSWITQNIKL